MNYKIISDNGFKFVVAALAIITYSAQTKSEASESPRIVTVGGAATEIVFALGSGDSVVATDLSSIYPPEARKLPMVGYVRSVSPEGILSMEPDLVIATGAFGPPTARQMMERLDVKTLWLPDLKSPNDLKLSITKVAEELGDPALAKPLIQVVDFDLNEAATRAEVWSESIPSVLFLIEPPGPTKSGMGGGVDSSADTLIKLAGGTNAVTNFSGFKPVSVESLVAMNPNVILVGQSDNHGGSPESIQAMIENPALAGVDAIATGSVHIVPLDDLSFGPRLGKAALRWNSLIGEAIDSAAE
ncbi:MAG: ABC transporter substrate-binding protein [Verrucomicrobiota bacterium]